jgi:MFS family permease
MAADKFGPFNVNVIMSMFTMIIILGLWLPARSEGAIIAFAALFGFGSGACIGLGPVLIMGISPMKEVGYRMGTILAIAGVGALTSPPIGGAIAAANGGSYVYASVFSGVTCFVAMVGFIILRGRVSRWKLATKV